MIFVLLGVYSARNWISLAASGAERAISELGCTRSPWALFKHVLICRAGAGPRAYVRFGVGGILTAVECAFQVFLRGARVLRAVSLVAPMSLTPQHVSHHSLPAPLPLPEQYRCFLLLDYILRPAQTASSFLPQTNQLQKITY